MCREALTDFLFCFPIRKITYYWLSLYIAKVLTELTLFVVKSKQKCADMHTKALKPFDKIKVSLHRMILSGKIVKAGGLVYKKTTKETKKTIAGIRAFIWHDPWIDAGGSNNRLCG